MKLESMTWMGMSRRRPGAVLVVCAAVLALGAPALAVAAPHAGTYFVSQRGSDGNPCTAMAPCATIGHAVSLASTGDTVVVQRGTYPEDVAISAGLTLRGVGHPTIDASGLDNGIVVTGADATIEGFTVENANFEGILVRNTSGVTVQGNVITGNDQGMFLPPGEQTGECAAVGEIPGDCGEGLHLWSVTGSRVVDNRVTGNAGGILLTDETGPTAFNFISGNTVVDNPYDCGVTIAGHNPGAAPGGVPAPSVAGIYSNLVAYNRADRNGLLGEGAGILLAGAGPGTAVYDNQVIGNEASGNGLSGLTMHNHAPGQDLNGNVIVDNRFGNDNLKGDPDFGDDQTTGILLASAVDPVTGTVVQGNVIRNVHYGIWTLNVADIPLDANHFANGVAVPLEQQ